MYQAMLRSVLVVLILAASSITLAFASGNRVALVIGNSAYRHAAVLDNPRNDAADMADAAEKLGFKVITGLDLDKAGMDRTIRQFAGALRGASIGMFFYAGHGLQVSGRNYLVPIDAELKTAEALDFEMVGLDVVQRVMENASETNILFVDACRDNPLSRNLARAMGTRSGAIGRGLVAQEAGAGTLISFSTQPGNVALDSSTEGRNSPYAAALTKHIATQGKDLAATLVLVRREVMAATGKRQIPWEHSALTAEILLAPQAPVQISGSAAAKATVSNTNRGEVNPGASAEQAPESDAVKVWRSIQDTTSEAILEEFVRQYGDSPLAIFAQARLKELRRQGRIGGGTTAEGAIGEENIGGEKDQILIATAGPMTGPYAIFGSQMKNGAQKAVADINAAGGLFGRRLRLEVGDDACDPKQAAAVASQFASKGVAFVAGHFCSGSSIPASHIYAEHRIPQISPASTNPRFTDERAGSNVFRVSGRDDQQAPVAASYIVKHFKEKAVAIIHDRSQYGSGLASQVKKAMNAAGKQEALIEEFTAGEKDYSQLISRLKRAGVDLVYLGGYHTEAGLIIREMRRQGMKAILMGGDALVTQEYWQITGSDGEGTLMTFTPDPRQGLAAASLVREFRASGIEPEGFVLYTYAAVQTWKRAVERAGSLDANKVVEALKNTKFNTVIGEFSFDLKGDPSLTPYTMYKWRAGNYEQL